MNEPLILAALAGTFFLAGSVKGVIGLSLPTVTLAVLSVLLDLPQAMALSKRAVWAARERGYSDAMEYGWSLLRGHWGHPDFVEGPRAFEQKREPIWNPDPDARTGDES